MACAAVRRLLLKKPHLCALCSNFLEIILNYMQIISTYETPFTAQTLPFAFYTFEREFGHLFYIKPAIFRFISNVAICFTTLHNEMILFPNILINIRSVLIDCFGSYFLLPTKCYCKLQSLLIKEMCPSHLNAYMTKSNLALVCLICFTRL